MVTRKRILAGLGLVALAWSLWYFFPSRERQVRRQIKALAAWVTKAPGEGALAAAMTAREAGKYFADPCEWTAEAFSLDGRVTPSEIGQTVFGALERFESLKVRFYDAAVDLQQDGSALVTATVRLDGAQRDGDPIHETHEVRCVMVKKDGRWLVRKVTVVEVLRK